MSGGMKLPAGLNPQQEQAMKIQMQYQIQHFHNQVDRQHFLEALWIPKKDFNKEWLQPNKNNWREKRKAKHPYPEEDDDRPQPTRASSRRGTGNRNLGDSVVEMPKPRRPGQGQGITRPPSNRPKRAKIEAKPAAPVVPRGPARPTTILGFDARQRLAVEHHIEAFGIPDDFDTIRPNPNLTLTLTLTLTTLTRSGSRAQQARLPARPTSK